MDRGSVCLWVRCVRMWSLMLTRRTGVWCGETQKIFELFDERRRNPEHWTYVPTAPVLRFLKVEFGGMLIARGCIALAGGVSRRAERVAAHYGLEVEVARNILAHCNTFVIVYDKNVDARPIGLWDVTADQSRLLRQRKGLQPDVPLL